LTSQCTEEDHLDDRARHAVIQKKLIHTVHLCFCCRINILCVFEKKKPSLYTSSCEGRHQVVQASNDSDAEKMLSYHMRIPWSGTK
jgi:hypothetical protein